MDQLSRAKIIVPVLLAAVVLFSIPAFCQQGAAIERGLQAGTGAGVEQVLTQSTDFAGEWVVRNWQSRIERSTGPSLGDYLGMPLNAAGRMRAETFDAGERSVLDLQCRPHPVPYQCQPHTELEYFPCTIVNENISDKVPHFLPGKNPWLKEFSEQEGLPYEATRGGAETMYPEYRSKMKNMKVAPIKPTPRAF